jgi:competence protein ComEC
MTERPVDDPHGVILDVGHGNAAVFFDCPQAIVVDAGSTDLVADTLERHGVSEIAALVISHRHHDHTSELPSLLTNPDLRVRRVFANADPTRRVDSNFERQLRGAWNVSRKRNGTELHQANDTIGHYMSTDRLNVVVLSPDGSLTWRGVGSKDSDDRELHPHALAVVLRVSVTKGRSVLFGSDLDRDGFRRLIANDVDIGADLLVYPHHGGLVAKSTAAVEQVFAEQLTEAVRPQVVVFSNGRESHPNPRREVVRGVRSASLKPRPRVVCTQLALACSPVVFRGGDRLDTSLGSGGAEEGLSCSGSVRIALVGDRPILPLGSRHVSFVLEQVGSQALCVAEGLQTP